MSSFFSSDDWANIITRTLNSEVVSITTRSGQTINVPVFRKAGLKVAIPNMPIGIEYCDIQEYIPRQEISELLASNGVDLIRVTGYDESTSFKDSSKLSVIKQPYTSINNLQLWESSSLPSTIKRNVKTAKKRGISIVESSASLPDISKNCFEIYSSTVQRHSGKKRYTDRYFSELIEASWQNDNLDCFVAMSNSDSEDSASFAGFLIVAYHHERAFYLHGGIDYEKQKMRPMDAMFHFAINHAKQRGCSFFDMAQSPVNQPNLIRYKEKWGGTTAQSITVTAPCSKIGVPVILGINAKAWLTRKPQT